VEQGTLKNKSEDDKYDEKLYYIMPKKTYSKRFSTDCFSDIFVEKALSSSVGLDDLPAYETEKANSEELQAQNSYFINDLMVLRNDKNDKEEKHQ
jgi:hypothetical protein